MVKLITEEQLSKEVLVNVTNPFKEIKDGDILFKGEYLIFSCICKLEDQNIIIEKWYNVYLDSEKLQ